MLTKTNISRHVKAWSEELSVKQYMVEENSSRLYISESMIINNFYGGTVMEQVWFNPGLRLLSLSVQSFACSPHVHVGFLWVLRVPPTVQKYVGRWSSYAKLPLSVTVSENSALWLTGVPSGMNSPTLSLVSRSTMNLTRTNWLQKMQMKFNYCYI